MNKVFIVCIRSNCNINSVRSFKSKEGAIEHLKAQYEILGNNVVVEDQKYINDVFKIESINGYKFYGEILEQEVGE